MQGTRRAPKHWVKAFTRLYFWVWKDNMVLEPRGGFSLVFLVFAPILQTSRNPFKDSCAMVQSRLILVLEACYNCRVCVNLLECV